MRHFSLTLAVAAVLASGFLSAGIASAGEPNPRTKQNLETAMHGEAYANLKYRNYAEMARQSGNSELAAVFEEAANVEANEHFAREADALKLAKTNEANLFDAMTGEHYENTKMYQDFARQAREDGDLAAASLFEQIAADEGDHYETYKKMLAKLKVGSEEESEKGESEKVESE
jgi:rubrerythrin